MTTQYFAFHREDAKWAIGEQVRDAKHAVMHSGYDLKSLLEVAAPRGLVILKATCDIHNLVKEPILERVVG